MKGKNETQSNIDTFTLEFHVFSFLLSKYRLEKFNLLTIEKILSIEMIHGANDLPFFPTATWPEIE